MVWKIGLSWVGLGRILRIFCGFHTYVKLLGGIIIIIIIIIIKNEKIRVTLCENAAGALYIINKMCVDGLRNVEG